MNRRRSFEDTLNHRRPERLILDLGGCPLSSMEGESEQRLLDFLGYGKRQSEEECLFGKTHRLDERLLTYLDIDTRSVGEIFVPKKSQFKKLSDTEYVDEWGICRRFTGLYWDAVNTPPEGRHAGGAGGLSLPGSRQHRRTRDRVSRAAGKGAV